MGRRLASRWRRQTSAAKFHAGFSHHETRVLAKRRGAQGTVTVKPVSAEVQSFPCTSTGQAPGGSAGSWPSNPDGSAPHVTR